MVETFTRKKVESLTLGERLVKFRGEARLSAQDMAKATKVQAKYIDFLEKGLYEKLPADVYVRGYLRSYARYLNIDEESLVRLYEQERNISQSIRPEAPKKNVFSDTATPTYTVSSKGVILSAIGLVIFGVAAYLFIQFRQFTTDPLLVIGEPNTNTSVTSKTVWLRGETDRGTQITINQKAVLVSPEGNFEEEISLQNGINQVIVRAVNRFNKERIETLQIEANYEEGEVLSSEILALRQAETEGLFRIALTIKEIPTKVEVKADGIVVFNEVLGTGDPRVFEAKDRFEVKSEKGNQVLVRQNAEEEPKILEEVDGPSKIVIFEKPGSSSENPL
jgi:transcriptional regulator with XRE-family HTH domain